MTRFKYTGGISWGTGGAGRSVAVMTENREGFQAYAQNVGHGMQAALQTLTATIAHLNSGGSATAAWFADQFFLTGEKLADNDRNLILSVLVKTLNGLTSEGFTIKVGGGGPGVAGWVVPKKQHAKPNPDKPYSNAVAWMDEPDQPIRRSAIHLSDANAQAGHEYVRHTLVHEATHKYAGTIDYCYLLRDYPWEPQTAFDDKAKALMNADSYALFSNLHALAASRSKPL